MRYLKTVFVVALAAMAMSAVIASSASAVKVCSTAGKGAACGGTHGNEYTGTINASLTPNKPAILTSGFITVSCTGSSASGSITSSNPAKGTITSLTFTGCTSGLGACTAKTTASAGTPYAAEATSTTNLKVSHNPITGEFTCGGITCKYTTTAANLTFDKSVWNGTSHSTAELTATPGIALSLEAGSSGFCSGSATWEADYLITTPDNLYLT